MAEYTAESIKVMPYLDMELLMSISEESRIGGEQMNRMVTLWEKWMPELNVRKLQVGKIQYIVTWLSGTVENDVDEAWDNSPSEAYLINNLAQVMVMQAIHDQLPQVQDAGCAPAPKPTEGLKAALAAEGCGYNQNESALERRYAVVTHFPFKGACDICFLQPQCPKGSGQGDSMSTFELPGHLSPMDS